MLEMSLASPTESLKSQVDGLSLCNSVGRSEFVMCLTMHDVVERIVYGKLQVLFVALKVNVHDKMSITKTSNKITKKVEMRGIGDRLSPVTCVIRFASLELVLITGPSCGIRSCDGGSGELAGEDEEDENEARHVEGWRYSRGVVDVSVGADYK